MFLLIDTKVDFGAKLTLVQRHQRGNDLFTCFSGKGVAGTIRITILINAQFEIVTPLISGRDTERRFTKSFACDLGTAIVMISSTTSGRAKVAAVVKKARSCCDKIASNGRRWR